MGRGLGGGGWGYWENEDTGRMRTRILGEWGWGYWEDEDTGRMGLLGGWGWDTGRGRMRVLRS